MKTGLTSLPVVALLAILATISSCGYLKTNPPPDVEKVHGDADQTAWLAAAANLLADAGYGRGNTVQDKAEKIYFELCSQFKVENTGWTDAAIQWWLESDFNQWADNPYKLVSVYGYKRPVLPWKCPDGSSFIGEQLRKGNLVAASISWPGPPGDSEGSGGHVLSCWGDDLKLKAPPKKNPEYLRVTDSDRSLGGFIQTYRYDEYDKPNPGGNSLGPGWYIAYDENHPFIKNIVVLSAQSIDVDDKLLVESLLSLRVIPSGAEATGFSAEITGSKNMAGLKTSLVRESKKGTFDEFLPKVTYNSAPVSFDFSRNPLPAGQPMTVNFSILTAASPVLAIKGISLSGVKAFNAEESFDITIGAESPEVPARWLPRDFTGGYLIGSLDIEFNDPDSFCRISKSTLRFLLQYPYDQDPERHFIVLDINREVWISSIRVGHSYGSISSDSLWNFEQWITYINQPVLLSGPPHKIEINWKGLLPPPQSEDISRKIESVPQ